MRMELLDMRQMKKDSRPPVIFPPGCFITSYAREETTKICQACIDYSIKKYNKNLWIYTDTDSCYTLLSKEELKEFINIDPVELGAWKIERGI